MEKATMQDLKNLKARLAAYQSVRADNERLMKNATVDDYLVLKRRQNEIDIKIMAVEEAIERISNKSFCKNRPEFSAVIINNNPNRYAR